jgi:phosphoglycerol transferase MdoB-like AlkP superfamily enzyme
MLWLGGAVERKEMKIEKLGSQVDIPTTILGQLGLAGSFPFAKDMLSHKSRSFAFYTYNEGFGFLTDTSVVGFDLKSRTPMLLEGKDPEEGVKMGKAYLQVLFNDYITR